MKSKFARISLDGNESSRQRHVDRGKLLPRDRVNQLLDPGSPFLEFSQFAAYEMYDDESPCASIITGIGRISGSECVIVVNDATVKGRTYYPVSVKNTQGARIIEDNTHLAVVSLVAAGATTPPHQDEMFADGQHFGRIFFNQANMSSKGISQLAAVMGSCTANGADLW
ncbi:MAG TPA: carboxyl transferase domain-containing protein [Pseudomonadales bacterium]|nr:carboxyl transferase domain-containing protein [Pseudomonadales bacterium]